MSLVTLGIDTSSTATSVGVWSDSFALAMTDVPSQGRPAHAASIIPMIEAVLEEGGLTKSNISRIAVGAGPGSFTGLRISFATAAGLGRGLGVPVVSVSSLEALLDPIAGPSQPVMAAIDARRGEVYVAQRGIDGIPGIERAVKPQDLVAELAGVKGLTDCLCVGDGALIMREDLVALGIDVPPEDDPRHVVDGSVVARLGFSVDQPSGGVLPTYLRDPDAVARFG